MGAGHEVRRSNARAPSDSGPPRTPAKPGGRQAYGGRCERCAWTALELCPLSNVRTGVIKSIEAHPLRQYFDAGIPVSLNTDDPLFFGNSLAMELESAQRAHRFTRPEIRQLMLSSIEATWLSADRKKRMAAEFQRDPSWNLVGL